MTPKQAAFVQQYLIDRNAKRAAIRAGYSAKTAEQVGYQLLQNSSVRKAIDEGLADVAARAGISAEMVLRERKRLAFFDPRKLFDPKGKPLPIHELDDDTAAAIAGLDVVEEYAGNGDERAFVGYTKKYKLTGKDPSLAALEKYFGLNEKAIHFTLPNIGTAEDCAMAQGAIIKAVAVGELNPTEGSALAGLVEARRRAIETVILEERIGLLERAMGARKGKR